MKKVGILTLHYSLNYGAVLQTYATLNILKSLGYDPIIIDRLPDRFSRLYPLIRKYIHPFTQKAFSKFRKKELKPISVPVFSSDELSALLCNNFDAVIIGSDQVWRKEVFSVSGDYFMLHQQHINIKKIAFAASTGVNFWQYSEQETKEISKSLRLFSGLSCREAQSLPILKEKCNVDIKNVLDPTLIADPAIYKNLCQAANKTGKGKIVTYFLDWNESKTKLVLDYSQKKNLKSVDILPSEQKRNNFLMRLIYHDTSVYNWVNMIATAQFVITDSFHGMVFSIIFNKQFVVVGNVERGVARFTSLLTKLGLVNRIVNEKYLSIDELPVEEINYVDINNRLSAERMLGIEFLERSL